MSRSKNSSKGSSQRDLNVKLAHKRIGYALDGVRSIDGKAWFKRYAGKVNRRALNEQCNQE